MTEKLLPVVECFGPTLQGEGALAGQRTLFIRFGYCDGAGDQWCRWCDSLFAVDPKYKSQWRFLTTEELVDELKSKSSSCRHVTLSGGNPALHDLSLLVDTLHLEGYTIHLETQGSVYRPWIQECDTVTVSPKPPSAGKCNLERFTQFMASLAEGVWEEGARVVLKVVCDPDRDDDYEFARNVLQMPFGAERYVSVLTKPTDTSEELLERYRKLADRVIADPDFPDVAVLPQLHILLWSHKRGV